MTRRLALANWSNWAVDEYEVEVVETGEKVVLSTGYILDFEDLYDEGEFTLKIRPIVNELMPSGYKPPLVIMEPPNSTVNMRTKRKE